MISVEIRNVVTYFLEKIFVTFLSIFCYRFLLLCLSFISVFFISFFHQFLTFIFMLIYHY